MNYFPILQINPFTPEANLSHQVGNISRLDIQALSLNVTDRWLY